jgi:hypothetical protein
MSTTETEEEEVYMAKSLKFINTYKKYFSPVLSNIASNLNAKNELIDAMNNMKDKKKTNNTNSNLKELITVLLAYGVHSDEVTEYKTDGVINHAAYVKQTLELMNIERSKERYYNLLFMVMQDMKDNANLMSLVQKNDEWKKMVGMLIPKGALVKIRDDIRNIEGVSKYSLSAINNKKTPITSNQLSGTVVERGVVRGGEFLKIVSLPKDILRHKKYHKKEFKPEEIELYEPKAETQGKEAPVIEAPVIEEAGEGEASETPAKGALAPMETEALSLQKQADTEMKTYFDKYFRKQDESKETKISKMKKIVNLKEQESDLWKKLSSSNAPSNVIDNAKSMELAATVYAKAWKKNIDNYENNAMEGKDEPEPPALKLGDIKPEIKPEIKEGGQQRITRKHKNSIIGSARKTRTNR